MVDSLNITKKDVILEIGTGNGELTFNILKNKPKGFIGIEKDKKLADNLIKKLKKDNFVINGAMDETTKQYLIINKDILKYKPPKKENLKIISSLPYSISSEIFQKIIKLEFKKGVFLSGKDFFNLINSSDSRIGFVISNLFNIKKIKEVSKDNFNPKPKVTSIIFSIAPKKIQNLLIKSIILQDDKKIKNALFNFYWRKGLTKKQAREKIKQFGIPEKILNKGIWQISNEDVNILRKKLL